MSISIRNSNPGHETPKGGNGNNAFSSFKSDLPAHTSSRSIYHFGALFGLVTWTNYLGESCWQDAMHRCEVFENTSSVVHGIDCGGRLIYVAVAVLAYAVSGQVFGAALSLLLNRDGEILIEAGVGSSDGKQIDCE